MKYREKSEEIEAFIYDGNFKYSSGKYYVPNWAVIAIKTGVLSKDESGLYINAESGQQQVSIGDYIVNGENGICRYKADLFEQIYEKSQPIDIFEDQEHLEMCLREWKHRLFLDHWLIRASITNEITDVDGKVITDVSGYNTFIFESCHANIQILSDRAYKENNMLFKHCMEKDLVHELLHCKYDWMGNQGGTYEGVYLDATEHQKLEEMAKSLIMAKYGVGYDYFM